MTFTTKHVKLVALGRNRAAVERAHVAPCRNEIDGEAIVEEAIRHVDEFREVDDIVVGDLELKQPVHVRENGVVVDRGQDGVVEDCVDLDYLDAILKLLLLQFRLACLVSGWRQPPRLR